MTIISLFRLFTNPSKLNENHSRFCWWVNTLIYSTEDRFAGSHKPALAVHLHPLLVPCRFPARILTRRTFYPPNEICQLSARYHVRKKGREVKKYNTMIGFENSRENLLYSEIEGLRVEKAKGLRVEKVKGRRVKNGDLTARRD